MYKRQPLPLSPPRYHAGTGHENAHGEWVDRAWWVRLVAYFVVCFPALDVVSAFPLNGITLGNNLMVMWFGSRIAEVENNKRVTNLFRLAVSIPPILFASKWNNINKITDYTGITGECAGGFASTAGAGNRERALPSTAEAGELSGCRGETP